MMSLAISEVCDRLKLAKTKTERTQILKENDNPALRGLLRMNYDSSLVLALPEGEPQYQKSTKPTGFGDTTLKASVKGWYVFVKELSPNVRQSKRESLFINLIESLDSKEAQVLLDAKDKKLDLGLTKKVIDEVFPGLIKSEGKSNGKKDTTTKGATTNDGSTSSANKSNGETT